jgi:hypothetical protein
MYTIAAKQWRSRTVRVRPPRQGRGAGGSSGARIAHNSSGTRVSTRAVILSRNRAMPLKRSDTPSKGSPGSNEVRLDRTLADVGERCCRACEEHGEAEAPQEEVVLE